MEINEVDVGTPSGSAQSCVASSFTGDEKILKPKKWWQGYIDDCGPEEPSYFAETMARTIPISPSRTRLLDLGCGSGIIGSFCLMEKQASSVTFTDLMPEWIGLARFNVEKQIARGRIFRSRVAFTEAVSFDMLPAELIARHDLICFNAPQLPTDCLTQEALESIRTNDIERTFRIGDFPDNPDGLRVAREFIAWHDGLLCPSPDAVMVLSSFLGPSNIARMLDAEHAKWEIIHATRTPLRDFFWPYVMRLSEADRHERRLERTASGWSKELFTVRIAGKKRQNRRL